MDDDDDNDKTICICLKSIFDFLILISDMLRRNMILKFYPIYLKK